LFIFETKIQNEFNTIINKINVVKTNSEYKKEEIMETFETTKNEIMKLINESKEENIKFKTVMMHHVKPLKS
jgi:gas vesicle protein